ncbi:neuropeptide-like 1 [Schistocerca piceifrons]|uniref:neuropeptide-like 1 n=1 Tax=Schistocerca piceifrons TaxID=274613 RepID=UPI001F5F5AC5|nr:neuropeptide-like 1 [Schistocerca piceifrons]
MRWCSLAALCAALAVAALRPPQAVAEPGDGLMVPGKRYVAALARNGELPLYGGWRKKQQRGDKRYTNRYGKRGAAADFEADDDEPESGVDALLEEIAATEQLRHLQLDALRRELDAQEAREEQAVLEAAEAEAEAEAAEAEGGGEEGADKRSVASLARAGALLPGAGKRNIAAMAKNGLLSPSGPVLLDGDGNGGEKRSVGALARDGLLPTPGRRGAADDDTDDDDLSLDSLMQQLYSEEEKRHIGSLARDYSLPSFGKRNLGSLARSGGLSNVRYVTTKKDDAERVGGHSAADKRNLASFMRSRGSSLVEKRYLASLVRSHGLPYPLTKKEDDGPGEIKRNVGALARNWMLPSGKRASDDDQEVDKRYLASVLRQGRSDGFRQNSDGAQDAGHEEEKRHVGSLAKSGMAIHKKTSRSAGSDGQAFLQQQQQQQQEQGGAHAQDTAGNKRSKRQAYLLPPAPPQSLAPAPGEFPMPVLQNNDDALDYGDVLDLMSDVLGAPEKRFLGVPPAAADYGKRHIGALARLGWLPSFRAAPARSGRSAGSRSGKRATRSHPADGPWPAELQRA